MCICICIFFFTTLQNPNTQWQVNEPGMYVVLLDLLLETAV